MLIINGNKITEGSVPGYDQLDKIERIIADRMISVQTVFTYPTAQIFHFELAARKEIVNASEDLNNSFFSFRLFRDAICNPRYWDITEEGGFRLKRTAVPHEAVADILKNSRQYGTECATAIVIVYYLALVKVLPSALFDTLFSDIYLMDWKYLDKDLGVGTYRGVKDSLLGDCLYFINPDVNPDTPEWQGENVIQLPDGYYYGHGIGIKTANGIIRDLNRNRRRGSETSAYLKDMIVKPDFKYLGQRYERFLSTV
jgi:protein-glutamine gamma-glutamyltransferase